MKIKYLGTAAAEALPALFCNCSLCRHAREVGGKEIRTRSQTLINDDLLIDFGPDTYFHVIRDGLDLSKIRTLLITHAHEDHYTPSELDYRRHGFAYLDGDRASDDSDFPELDVYISRRSYKYFGVIKFEKKYLAKVNCPVRFHHPEAFEPFISGKYSITPLEANHAPGMDAFIYLITDGEKTILYAHDTGLLPEKDYSYMKYAGVKLDLVSLDCTGMAATHNTGNGRHMNLERNKITRARLIEDGAADENTIFVCNHFSHNGQSTHEQLCRIMGGEGFEVSFDGMEIDL